jgi:hypothetical protein
LLRDRFHIRHATVQTEEERCVEGASHLHP